MSDKSTAIADLIELDNTRVLGNQLAGAQSHLNSLSAQEGEKLTRSPDPDPVTGLTR